MDEAVIDDLRYAGWNSGGADPQGIEGAPPPLGGGKTCATAHAAAAR
jgi:hypothetical protein